LISNGNTDINIYFKACSDRGEKKYHTGNDSKMATKNTTLWEQFQNEKKIPQYGNNSKTNNKKYQTSCIINKKSLKIPKGNQNPYIEEE
jgi:hypothetical protein